MVEVLYRYTEEILETIKHIKLKSFLNNDIKKKIKSIYIIFNHFLGTRETRLYLSLTDKFENEQIKYESSRKSQVSNGVGEGQ